MSNLESLYAASGAEVKELFTVAGATHGLSALTDSIGYANTVFRFNAEAAGEGWATSNTVDAISLRGTKYGDTISNSGADVTISTGAGNDSVYNSANNVTITGGAGNDTVVIDDSDIVYNYEAGNDVIFGVSEGDTISISPDYVYRTAADGADLVISFQNSQNTITLKDAATVTPYIEGTHVKPRGNDCCRQ